VFRLTQLILTLFVCVSSFGSEEVLTPEFLAQKAEFVVRGKVLSKTFKRDSSKRIVTEVEVQVSEVWKGEVKGSEIKLTQLGGILGEEIMTTSAQANYAIDEDVLLFLVKSDNGSLITVSAGHGKYKIDGSGTSATGLGGNLVQISELKKIVSKKQ
jgi:hypothetical protein